jgi:hypothetical protein
MRRSTVLSLPVQLVFPGLSYCLEDEGEYSLMLVRMIFFVTFFVTTSLESKFHKNILKKNCHEYF